MTTMCSVYKGFCAPATGEGLRSFQRRRSPYDTFYVVTGAIRIFLQRPKEEVRLTQGETYSVPPKRPHLVTNAGDTSAVFLVLQGIGDYDFVPLADTRTGEHGRQKPGR